MKENCDIAENKFRPLKKELQTLWKKIKYAVAKDQFPEQSCMDDFVALARVMVTYNGFGDKQYGPFLQACDQLYESFSRQDYATFKEAYCAVKNVKQHCHQQHRSK